MIWLHDLYFSTTGANKAQFTWQKQKYKTYASYRAAAALTLRRSLRSIIREAPRFTARS